MSKTDHFLFVGGIAISFCLAVFGTPSEAVQTLGWLASAMWQGLYYAVSYRRERQ